MLVLQAILLALLATCSQWWFSHLVTRSWLYPIWSGFLAGVILGHPVEGTIAAAYIQLTYLGWITAGGTMPGNLMVAGIFGVALTVLSGADPTLAPSIAVTLSMIGILINQAYMTINAFWIHKAEDYLNDGNIKMVRVMNYLPSFITALVLYGIPAFLVVILGAEWLTNFLGIIPESIISALNLVGSIMPALGIAMLLNYLGNKKNIIFFFLGYFLTVYLKLDTMAIFIFGSCIAFALYFIKNNEERVA